MSNLFEEWKQRKPNDFINLGSPPVKIDLIKNMERLKRLIPLNLSLREWMKKKPRGVVEIGDGKPPFKINI